MSDYEYEGRSGYPLFVIIISSLITIGLGIVILIFWVLPTLDDYNKNLPTQIEHSKAYEKLDNLITKELSNSNITCPDIQSLREQHIVSKNWWEDPLGSDSNFDTARDLWNAKNCGNHWGWFES